MITCVIIDDEEMAVERIEREVNKRPGWQVVGAAKEYEEAKSLLLDLEPDVCFMDINIISGSGMALAESLQHVLPTKWIFSTAYAEFAVNAFDIDALGYLLKPYENKKLQHLLSKAEESQAKKASAPLNNTSKIAVKSIGEVKLIDTESIMWVKGASNYIELHCKDKMYLHRETLTNIEQRLPENRFIRVHRSAIVNLDFINKIESELGRYSMLIMKNGDEIKISNAYKMALFSQLGLH